MNTKNKTTKAKAMPEKLPTHTAPNEPWDEMLEQQESVADFKARLASMLPKPDTKADRPCLRKPTDRGYYPPSRKVVSGQRTIKQNDSTGIVERPNRGISVRMLVFTVCGENISSDCESIAEGVEDAREIFPDASMEFHGNDIVFRNDAGKVCTILVEGGAA